MKPTVASIVQDIVHLSLSRDTGSTIRDIYTVLMDITAAITTLFNDIQNQERENNK